MGSRLSAQAGLTVGQMKWVIYMLKSSKKDWYYVGSTNNIERRLREHNNGEVHSTKAYKPLSIFYTREFDLEDEAREYERKLKKKRIEKESIIRHIKGLE